MVNRAGLIHERGGAATSSSAPRTERHAGHAHITVTYTERPDGAVLTYPTEDAQLVGAIHSWFDRQVMDHGDNATSG